MRAGKLDRRIQIVREIETARNALNEPIVEWTPVATVWAQARWERGDERFEAQRIAGSAVMGFHMRYRGDLTVKDRIVFEGRTFDIRDVREIGRRVVTEVDCVARAD
jgi:SPP1 family predicted phage head-tail adaptor